MARERGAEQEASGGKKQTRPEIMFYQADKLIEAGQVKEAAELLFELVEKYPDFGRAYNHLGYMYETKFRDYLNAEQCYKKALELSPDYPATYLNYGIMLSSQGRFEELKTLLSKALECPGINKSKIHNEYGIMYELKGEFEIAIEAYRTAIRYSFSKNEIEAYQASIARVLGKQNFLGK